MSSKTDYTLCMRCAANNLPVRDLCWQCGALLPNTTGPDGFPRAYADPAKKKLKPEELQRLLDESQTLDMTVTNKPSRPDDPDSDSNSSGPTMQGPSQSPMEIAQSWFQRVRNRQSEA